MPQKLDVHIVTTETAATKPARHLAMQTVADLSDRRLAFFHWREASETLADIEHKVRDYGEEDSPFDLSDAQEIDEAIAAIEKHLFHVRSITAESATRTKLALPAGSQPEDGGAS